MNRDLMRLDLVVLAYAVVAAAVIVLVWPGSRAGRAVESVTASLAGALRGGG